MFQFPANPLVGQVFAPIPGIQYKWTGTGWAPFASGILTKTDTDLLYVPLTQRAAANGVATLDAATKVPMAQLLADVANGLAVLDANVKVAMARLYAGVADGLATLDGTAKVPVAQLHGAEANGVATLDADTRVPLAQLAAVFSIFVGCIMWRQSVGPGMLQANGQVVSKVTYADLWAYAQGVLTADQVANPGLYRSVDAGNFALPKLDGLFIRGQGQVDAQHVSGGVGVKQADDNKSHTHPLDNGGQIQSTGAGPAYGSAAAGLAAANIAASGGPEARPVNVAMVPCIFTGRFA